MCISSPGIFLEGNQCKCNTSGGFFVKSIGTTCQSCDSSCKNCINNETSCTECNSGYYPNQANTPTPCAGKKIIINM